MRILCGIVAVLGRLALSAIFLVSAITNKIPHFSDVATNMGKQGMPAPRLMLVGAIVFLLAGSVSLLIGYRARIGALLLLVFLALATCYFHDFWTLADAQAKQQQMIHFMKNVAMMGAMLLVIAQGAGPLSLDARTARGASQKRPVETAA